MALDFFAGCVGGCAGVLVGHPLDTVKVRIQTQDTRNPQYRGTFHCLSTIVRKESVKGLYKGISSPMAGVTAVNAILFGVYGNVQRNMPNPDSLVSVFLAGSTAGILQAVVCSPMELAKTRLQLQADLQMTGTVGTNTKSFKDKVRTRYSGPIDCLKKIKAADGWRRGVFRGYSVTVLREAPSFGIYFLSYELLSRLFSQGSEVGTLSILMAGGLSGIASWAFTYPIDVVKSRVQADGARIYRGAYHCAVVSYKNEGWRVFTRGVNSTIIRAFPTNAATFVAVSWTLRMFNGSTASVSNVAERIKEPVKSVEEIALSKVVLTEVL